MDLSTNLYPLRDDDESELVVARPGQASRKGNKSLKLKTASLTWFLGCISRPGVCLTLISSRGIAGTPAILNIVPLSPLSTEHPDSIKIVTLAAQVSEKHEDVNENLVAMPARADSGPQGIGLVLLLQSRYNQFNVEIFKSSKRIF